MDNSLCIYALTDPDTGSVRYIGLSKSPHARYESHINAAKLPERKWRVSSPAVAWLRNLRSNDSRPGFTILESDIQTLEEAREREDYWIDHYLAEGCDILNARRNHGQKLEHQEYYKEARERMVELAAPAFLARQRAGERFIWDGEPRWLREKIFYYIRVKYSDLPRTQQLFDYLNNYEFSNLPLDKLEKILAVIKE